MEYRASARIHANDHRVIEVSPDGWRLLSANGTGEAELLAEAARGTALTYPTAFGARLRLPDGSLPSTAIERVVLGWSASDQTWHLGLILAPPLAENRGSRWCGLARWHDPAAETHRGEAAEAGRALALALARPLAIVPPRPGETQTTAPAEPPPPLPALPYTFDEWTLSAHSDHQLRFTLSPAWRRGRLLRAVVYVALAALFLVLSITSLTAGIMLPQPELLPWLGFLSAAWLLILALRSVFQTQRQAQWVEIDSVTQMARSDRWQVPVEQIDSVVASQIVKTQKRGTPTDHVRYGELHLRLRDGSFQPVLAGLRFDLKLPAAPPAPADGSLAPLTEYSVRTPLQAAAVRIARLIGAPAWDDRREG